MYKLGVKRFLESLEYLCDKKKMIKGFFSASRNRWFNWKVQSTVFCMDCEEADLFGWRSGKMEEARENNNLNIFNQAKHTFYPMDLCNFLKNSKFWLKYSMAACPVWLQSHEIVIKAHSWGEAKGIVWFQSSIIFPSVVLWSFNYLHLRWTEHNDVIKHLGFLFQGCQKSPGWVDRRPIVHIDLCLLLWTIKATCHVKERFDFWDIWGRAGPSSNLPSVWLPYQTAVIIQRF